MWNKPLVGGTMSGGFNWHQVLGEQVSEPVPAATPEPTTAPASNEIESLINAIPDRGELPTNAHPAPSMAVEPTPVAPNPVDHVPAVVNDKPAPMTSPYEEPKAYQQSETTHLPNYMLVDDPDQSAKRMARPDPNSNPNAYDPGLGESSQPVWNNDPSVPEQFRAPTQSQFPANQAPSPNIHLAADGLPYSQVNPEEVASTLQIYNEAERIATTELTGAQSLEHVHLDDILRIAVDRKASDIHITVGLPPMARIDGEVVQLPYKIVKPMDSRRLMFEIMNDERITKYETNHELDFSHSVREIGRFRVNVYMQRGSVAAAIRTIPTRIPSFEELELPDVLREVCKRTSGLILVTGPTGSGKSTTIATMINDINEHMPGHIMTLEDPIEYIHQHKRCMVNQRELHSDTYSFHNALRAVLREDPDIILVGELRDHETIEAALTLAETGHLVFGTLHTRNAPATIDRIIDVFPSDQQSQIRVLLGNTLEGVVSQQLLPKIGGGRRAALEVMLGVPAVRNLIREGKTHQMYSVIETSKSMGMMTMDSSLAHLFKTGQCTWDECLIRAVDKDSFSRLVKSAA